MDSYQNESTAAAASPAVDYSARRRAMLLGSGIAGVLLIAATQVPSARLTGTTALSIPSKNGVGPMKYRKSQGKYPPSGIYGELLGDDQIQKNWPGLTCERSDDDKWEWGNSAVQKDQSGTNCLWGDTDYCLDMMENPSWRKNNVAWNMCNSTCNYTDVDLVRRGPYLERGPMSVSYSWRDSPSLPPCRARPRSLLLPTAHSVGELVQPDEHLLERSQTPRYVVPRRVRMGSHQEDAGDLQRRLRPDRAEQRIEQQRAVGAGSQRHDDLHQQHLSVCGVQRSCDVLRLRRRG